MRALVSAQWRTDVRGTLLLSFVTSVFSLFHSGLAPTQEKSAERGKPPYLGFCPFPKRPSSDDVPRPFLGLQNPPWRFRKILIFCF